MSYLSLVISILGIMAIIYKKIFLVINIVIGLFISFIVLKSYYGFNIDLWNITDYTKDINYTILLSSNYFKYGCSVLFIYMVFIYLLMPFIMRIILENTLHKIVENYIDRMSKYEINSLLNWYKKYYPIYCIFLLNIFRPSKKITDTDYEDYCYYEICFTIYQLIITSTSLLVILNYFFNSAIQMIIITIIYLILVLFEIVFMPFIVIVKKTILDIQVEENNKFIEKHKRHYK